ALGCAVGAVQPLGKLRHAQPFAGPDQFDDPLLPFGFRVLHGRLDYPDTPDVPATRLGARGLSQILDGDPILQAITRTRSFNNVLGLNQYTEFPPEQFGHVAPEIADAASDTSLSTL